MKQQKLNCWDVIKCGREPGGPLASELGVCPAATDSRHDGVNGGRNAGRYCWRIAGTLCDGSVQGGFAEKALTCSKCEFFQRVVREEKDQLKI